MDNRSRLLRSGVAIALLFGAIPHQEAQPATSAEQESVLHAVLRVAQRNELALGIVQVPGKDLCKAAAVVFPDHPADVSAAISVLAAEAGYSSQHTDDVIVIQPQVLPEKLQRSIEFRFGSFPKLKGTMSYMGMNLQGSLSVAIDGARGFALEDAEGPDSQSFELPSTSGLTTVQIANRVVNFGPKGVWVLGLKHSVSPASSATRSEKATSVVFNIYSYHDNVRALNSLDCSAL